MKVFLQHLPERFVEVNVIYKWGLDGSGCHSINKQHFANNPQYSDSNIILSTIVPLEISVICEGQKLIFWKNTTPSSTRWYRPIAFILVKETNVTILQEYNSIEQQPTKIDLDSGKTIQFKHIAICSMMDEKHATF